MTELLEDPDGAPYPEEVQAFATWLDDILRAVHLDDAYGQEARDNLVAALESVAKFEANPSPVFVNSCPECNQGKHVNCTVQVLGSDDELHPCPCRHGDPS